MANRSVIHVDDDPQMLRLFAQKFKRSKYDFESIEDPSQLMGRLAATNTKVVLLDVSMPNVDGFELLKEIKQHDGGINVIMVTGKVSQSTIVKAMRWGAVGCVFKPVDFTEIRTILKVAFENVDRWVYCLRKNMELESPLQV